MPFKKGEVSNPKGRPPMSVCAARLARAHAEKAINTLVKLMNSSDENSQYKGATALLERGFGKAPQHVEIEHVGDQVVGLRGLQDLLERVSSEVTSARSSDDSPSPSTH